MCDQIPLEERPQSQTYKRLQDALAEKTQIQSASDADIAARIAPTGTVPANSPQPPTTIATADNHDSATTQPAVSGLEIQLLFPGSRSQGQADAIANPPVGCELVTLHAPGGKKIVAIFGKATGSRPATTRPSILYFYGNGTCMAYSLDVFNRFRGLGFNVIMADYPGYGMSEGSASESGCYATADAQYDYLLTRSDVDKGRMVSAGWSLGAAVAIDLASRRRVAGLATFSAFTNIADMSRTLLKGLPLVIPLSSRFDNLAKIGSVSVPIFMAHGTQDQLVPPEMLDQLAKSAKTAVTTVRVNGAAHNDIFQRGGNSLYQKVKAYVDGLSAVAPTTRP